MRVLHVVESFGAGTASAVLDYIRNTPTIEHHLAYSVRAESISVVKRLGDFASTRRLPKSPLRARRVIREFATTVGPDVVHAHSSIGGFLARISVNSGRLPVVYTPHCFAFERRDVPWSMRLMYRAAEKLLARNTAMILACSPREASLAAALRRDLETRYVPNVGTMQVHQPNRRAKIVTIGRLGPQKDPALFSSIAQAVRARMPHVEFTWIGSGDGASSPGPDVSVTGWLGQSEVARHLAEAELYVHTAAWEGFPISILEAHRAGLPVVVRQIPAYEPLDDELKATTADDLAALCLRLMSEPRARSRNIEKWSLHLAQNQDRVQSEQLERAYRHVMESRR